MKIGIVDGGAYVSLTAPVLALDVSWSCSLLEDGGILLPDGGITSVAALEAALDAGAIDSGSAGVDSGIVVFDL
jgi:hypothetical protein